MREAIEKLVAELERISGNAFFMMDDEDRGEHGKGVCAGRRTVAEYTINQLKAVIANDTQIQREENNRGWSHLPK